MWEEVWDVRDQLQNRLKQLGERYGEEFSMNFNVSVADKSAYLEIEIPNMHLISASFAPIIKGEPRHIKGWLLPTLDSILRQ